ncbi:putative sphingosine N-acyltransferase [Podospora australis]|uniref:Sphingosine N-acyltransferase n=1 Tax=Podospora australis TaxID=1536484 RepID=A0AAN6WLA2_9PEZI|nr:putative sphingosine N-acyltransferase [Podospora australis]
MSSTPTSISNNGHDQDNKSAALSASSGPQRSGQQGSTAGSMKAPFSKPANGNSILVRRAKRKDDGPMEKLVRWFVRHQVGLSFNLLALLFLAHGMPRAREHTSKFFMLSYYNPDSGKYFLGGKDGYLMLFCVVLFTGLRAATMEYILSPFARAQGIHKKKDVTRFSEQAWLLVYYCVFWPLGVYIYCTSPYYLDLHELWTTWPRREMDGLMKGYIIAQLSFWFQQLLVIHLEDRRKDHWQMFSHHIVTSTVLYAAYRQAFTGVANLVLVLMDVVDIFLPLAKCLKYMGYKKLCDFMFAVFMVSWFIARHILFPMVIWSVWAHTIPVIGSGCYSGPDNNLVGPFDTPSGKDWWVAMSQPLWDSDAPICFDHGVMGWFLAMLLFLQGLAIMWFTMVIQVAIKVIRGDGAEDSRSDDEADEEEDQDEFVYEEAQPLEEEVGADEIDLKNWERRARGKRQAAAATTTASGVSLPGHSDRKELLGRIGCEKQVD